MTSAPRASYARRTLPNAMERVQRTTRVRASGCILLLVSILALAGVDAPTIAAIASTAVVLTRGGGSSPSPQQGGVSVL